MFWSHLLMENKCIVASENGENKNINPLYNLADKNLHFTSGGEGDHKVLARRTNPVGRQQAVRVSLFPKIFCKLQNCLFFTQNPVASSFPRGNMFSWTFTLAP